MSVILTEFVRPHLLKAKPLGEIVLHKIQYQFYHWLGKKPWILLPVSAHDPEQILY